MALIWIIFIAIAIAGLIVQGNLDNKFRKYSKIPIQNGMTGREIAEKMLRDNNVFDVKVTSVRGHLTDYYNPASKTINLSESTYNRSSVAAAAVAAHETGHVLQHVHGYVPLRMRTALVPIVSIASRWVMWIILGGIILIEVVPWLLWLGIILFAVTTIFSFITLPVERNASYRAIQWLSTTGITDSSNSAEAVDALQWAGYTYVVAALSSLASLFYYIAIAVGASRR